MNEDPMDQLAQATVDQPTADRAFEDAIARQVGALGTQALRQSLMGAAGTTPDAAAKVVRLADRTGLPAPVVERNMGVVQRNADIEEYDALLKASPRVRQWLSDPINARLSSDDVARLAKLESHWARDVADVLRAVPGGAVESVGKGVQGLADLYAATTRSAGRIVDKGLSAIGAPTFADLNKAAPLDPRFLPSNLVRSTVQPVVDLGAAISPPDERKTLGTDVAEGLGQIAAQIAAAMFTGGAATGALLLGQGAGQLEDRARKAGKAGTPEADAAVQLGAAVTALSEKIGLDLLMNRVAPPIRNAIMRKLVDVAAAGGIEAVQETVEGVLHNVIERGLIDPNQPIFEGLEREAAAAGGAGAIARAILMAVTPGKAHVRDRSVAETGKAQVERFNDWIDATAGSPLLERSPDRFGQVVDAATEGQRVFLPVEKVVEYFQSLPSTEADALAAAWGIADQLPAALAVGGDVVMTVGQYRQHVEGAGAHTYFKNDLRLSAVGASLNDAANFEATYERFLADQGPALTAGATEQAKAVEPARRVYADLETQAMNAGFTPDNARQYAALYAAHYQTRAARLGQGDAWELYQKARLEVRQVLPESLRAVAPDQMELLLNALRKGGGKGKSQTSLLGPSLLEYVSRKGGVFDEGGDLKAMGADGWHKGKPGWKKLIREAGDKGARQLDDMALSAFEAGYFPELTERPSIQEFLDAVDGELRGKPRRPLEMAGDRPWEADFDAAIRDLDETLSRAGVDIKTVTNRQARDALRRYEAEAGGYDQPAYHGSPHVFDKFSLDAIGTGEGAQAYGWGLYFAGKKGVAEHYRRALAGRNAIVKFRGEEIGLGDTFVKAWVLNIAADIGAGLPLDVAKDKQIRDAEERVRLELRNGNAKEAADARAALAVIRGIKDGDIERTLRGRLYEVEIPDDGAYLLWDKPLSEQSPAVRDALAKLGVVLDEAARAEELDWIRQGLAQDGEIAPQPKGAPNPTGEEIYRKINRDQRAASKALLAAGIPGIKYLDGSSRSAGDGSYNYVIFDDSLVSIRSYEQAARGSITFSDGRTLIQLFAGRDLSTFLHETGHLWLEELRADSSNPMAPQRVRDDWEVARKWMGLAEGEAVTVEAHEKWARGFEAWLMEGKAPSHALGEVFSRFKAWLVSIYKTARGLNVEISDEMRDVFARLVATDEEIEAVSDDLRARALFGSADQAGMTDAEFDAYLGAVEMARDTATTDLLRRVMSAIRRRRTAEWNAEAADVRRDVVDTVNARPDLNALHYLRTGKTLDGRGGDLGRARLSKADLLEMYATPTVLDALPKGVPAIYVENGGAHPDAIAETMGFASGREMVDALMALEVEKQALVAAGDKRSVREVAIVREVERVMRERHGDALSDGSIEEEARDALHNEGRAEVLAVELKALGRRAGIEPTPLQVLRRWAKDTIGDKTTREAADTALHMRAERKAARAVEKALLAGDHEEAFRQKQAQLVAHVLYVEANKAKEQVETGRKMLDRYASAATIKSMDQDYLDQIHGLLERLSLKPESRNETARRVSLRSFAERLEAEGRDVVIPEELLDEARKRNFSELTFSEFRGLTDSVRQIAHLGRLKKKLQLAADQREFDEAVDEAVGIADRQPRAPDPRDERGLTEWQRKLGVPGQVLRSMDASLLKIETIVDWLDGGDANGPWNRYVFRPIADAQARERAIQKEKMEGFAALMKALPDGTMERWQEKLVLTELPNKRGQGGVTRMLRSELVAVALNVGNESNHDKLLRGEGWDAAALKRAFDKHLTKADWDFVQGTWDLIETLWPQIAEMERRVNGVVPEKVEARVVETPHGVYRGGYYPLVYDPKISFDVDVRAEKSADSLWENHYSRATTPKGFTKQRIEGYARPIWLSLEVVPRHLSEVAHDIAFRETLMEADKFLADTRVREAVEGALGRDYYKQFKPWLQAIANEWAQEKRGTEFWEGFLKASRANVTMVAMGFRMTTMLAQAGGLSDSTEYLGARWVASGLKAFMSNPMEAYRFATGKSSEMANRMGEVDRDIRDQARRLLGKGGAIANAQRFAFYGIGIMDMGVSLPTWIGGYNKALSEGMDEADAVYAADKAVRTTQGAGSTKDLAAVSRRNEFWRIATMFYSYFGHLYQRQRNLARDLRAADSVGDYAMVAARSFWLLVVPALFGAWAGGQGPEDDENPALWALRKVTFNLPMSVPILRDISSGLENTISGKFRGGYSYTPIARAFETAIKLGGDFKDLAVEGEVNEGFLKRMIEVPGYALGLPVGQIGSTSQFLWDVLVDGDQHPENFKDWLDGLIYGPDKKKR